MKKIKVLFMMLAAALFIIPVASAQNKTDDILGKWLNEDEDAHIEITKRILCRLVYVLPVFLLEQISKNKQN